jgi:hypothetical protein
LLWKNDLASFDNHAFGSMALETKYREHGLEGIFHISAKRRRLPIWYEKEASQLECMIDPDCAKVAHVRRDDLAKAS